MRAVPLKVPVSRFLALCGLGLIGALQFPANAVAEADPVAVVTDVAGEIEVKDGGPAKKVGLLTEFAVGASAQLHANTRMVVLYLRSGTQYLLSGPGLVRFGPDAPESSRGASSRSLRALTGRDGTPLRLRYADLAQSGMVMRAWPANSIPALNLAGTTTLERVPVFRWKEIERGLEYQFVLKDADGSTLFYRDVRGGFLALPADRSLDDGKSYRWSITCRAGPGLRFSSEHKFQVADPQLRAAVDNFRPGSDAPVAERVAFALWLGQLGLRDDAADAWKRIAEGGLAVPTLNAVVGQ